MFDPSPHRAMSWPDLYLTPPPWTREVRGTRSVQTIPVCSRTSACRARPMPPAPARDRHGGAHAEPLRPGERRDVPARLLDEQQPGHRVPRRQLELHVSVVAPLGDVREL